MNPLSCGVSTAGNSESLSRRVYEALSSGLSPGLKLLWRPDSAQESDCNLLVLPVQPPAMEFVAAEITRLRQTSPACSVILVCTDLRADQVAALLAAGAFDFVLAPFPDHELCTRVQRAAGLLRPARCSGTDTIRSARAHGLIRASPCFLKQLSALPVIAGCDASVLLLGETGTGKELFARSIHYLSPRASKPLVAVNCGAIPTELVESELFGCIRGAYTSAHAARSGLVREAEGGTLFLDEIDSLPLGAQTKLLRFLQEKEYRPVGAAAVLRADVRVLTAANHDVRALVERGAFRRDLYFRLNVLTLELPSLRERPDDIPELARHFIEQFCRKGRRSVLSLTAPAMRKLLSHSWPGNVRELSNVIERAVLFCHGPLIAADDLQLPDEVPPPEDVESFRAAKARTVEAFERSYIERLLSVNAGNITRAASAARKNRRAFFALMRKHAIAPERFRGSKEVTGHLP
jgi:DNA-binding NtrC family response regulator